MTKAKVTPEMINQIILAKSKVWLAERLELKATRTIDRWLKGDIEPKFATRYYLLRLYNQVVKNG